MIVGLSKRFLLVLVGFALVSSQTQADTYNFYFKGQKGKKQQEAGAEGQPDFSVNEDGGDPHQSKPVNPLTKPADGSDETPAPPNTSQLPPIIINNTNNIGIPQEPPKVAEAPTHQVSELDVMITPPKQKVPSQWRLGAGFNFFNRDPGNREQKRENYGASLSLGFVKQRGLAFNFYGGLRANQGNQTFHVGGDVELMPIRSHASIYEVPFFEGGFLFGVSTLAAHRDNWLSGHAGLRMNFNFSENVGLSIVGRSNLGYVMGEAGIVTRI